MNPSYAKRLSLNLWRSRPGSRGRFWLSPEADPGLAIEIANDEGRAAYGKFRKRMGDHEGVSGVVLVDRKGRFIFAGATVQPDTLDQLAAFVAANIGQVPALAGLIGAGVARAELPEAIAAPTSDRPVRPQGAARLPADVKRLNGTGHIDCGWTRG